jgi:hypothetical protein
LAHWWHVLSSRFQALRNLIPQNDQKRDKASFLLEVNRSNMFHFFSSFWFWISASIESFFFNFMQVIEYIQFLQEKLQVYEGSYEGWSQEPAKLLPWVNFQFWTCSCPCGCYCFWLTLVCLVLFTITYNILTSV